MKITKKEAQKELAKREIARRDFLWFLRYTFPGFQDVATQGGNPIHKQITGKLQQVADGQIKRLMIFCPPRLGKSIISSQYFPAYFLGREPSKRIIQASYGADLASDFGRKTKQIVQTQEYKNVYPDFGLSKDKREGGNRETSKGGGMYTVGVGGATTGKGADILIIDDPVKDRMEADSATIQERNIEWYDSVASTRLMSQDSAIIIIMTRWNIYDLGGYLLEEEKVGGDKREKLVIQGIDEEGNEIVRPGKRDEGYMQTVKGKMLPKNWAALYQQDPIASMDGIFKKEYFSYFLMSDFEKAEGILKKEDLEVGIFIDPAFSTSSDSDDAVIAAVGRHKISKEYYLLDLYADTSAPSRTRAGFYAIYSKLITAGYKVKFLSVEQAFINKQQTEFVKEFKRALVERQITIPLYMYESKVKKEVRIKDTLEGVMSQNGIKFRNDMEDPSLNRRMEKQFLEFPNGKHDDIIDCIAQGVDTFNNKISSFDRPKETRYKEVRRPDIGKLVKVPI